LVQKLQLFGDIRGDFMTYAQRFTMIHSFLVLLFLGQAAQAQLTCGSLFGTKNPPIAYQEVKVAISSNKLTKLARSNAPQSWAWFKERAYDFLPDSILKHIGNIEGDPHNGNYGPTLVDGKVKWRSLDYDDGGTGPYILDFAKFLIAVKAVDTVKKVKASDLWQVYQRGIQGKDYKNPPQRVTELLDMTPEQFRNLEVKKALKFSTGDRLMNDGDKSSKITDQKTYDLVMQVFSRQLPEGLRVLDVGGREKEGGGSGSVDGEGGALRFIALVKGKDGRNTLYELKEDANSGIENYQRQDVSLQDILNFHVIGEGKTDLNYQEVNVNIDGDRRFVLRPKPLYFYDYANKSSTRSQYDEFAELSLYNAWYKGHIVSLQKNAPQYLKIIEADKKGEIFEGLKRMTWEYLEFLEKYLPK
jgi:hypothetical protein